jgi:hypothetical protein
MAKYDDLMKWLALIGGIIALIEGIVGLFWRGLAFWGFAYVWPIIAIILAIIVILSAIKPNAPIPFTAIVLLILGILLIIFGAWGGILVLIAGILGFINK